MTPARALSAEEVRNPKNVLAAAGEQTTAHGPEVGMDEIAAATGVAVGNLYRHSPTRTDLVAAVVAAYVAEDAETALEVSGELGTPEGGELLEMLFAELSPDG